jgi:hypothetical protein
VQPVARQLKVIGLCLGAASPFLYAAAQFVAAPLYPGYDWRSQLASELGTVGMSSARVFNIGIVLSGLATLASALSFKIALDPITPAKALPWLVAASLVSSGGASIWAGLHPLPAAIHDPGFWGAGTVAFPVLLAVTVWRPSISLAPRLYLAIGGAMVIGFLAISSSQIGATLSPYDGAMQRIGAFLVYSPMTVAAVMLLRKIRFEDPSPVEARLG